MLLVGWFSSTRTEAWQTATMTISKHDRGPRAVRAVRCSAALRLRLR
jgi:hypothetical protein